MTASILKQVPNTSEIQKNTVYQDKTQHANFLGNPLYQATKWHLNKPLNGGKTLKRETESFTPKICMLGFVLINSIILNLLCVWICADELM